MRSFRWLGRLFLLAILAAFVLPGFAEADRGRGRGRDGDRGRWNRGRVVVRTDIGRRHVHYHDRHCGHWDRGRHLGWRNRERVYYPSRHRHYPEGRRGSVGVVIHIPF